MNIHVTPQTPVYVFQLPIRIWHWSMVLAIPVLIVTGYIIGKPWHSIDGDPTFLFYMGYTRMAHFIAGFILGIGFIWRLFFAFTGNSIARQIFVIPFWRKEWLKDLVSDIRWYLFLDRSPSIHMGHNPLAQLGMSFCLLMITLMLLTGFAMYAQNSTLAILAPFHEIVDFAYWTGGNPIDIHSWHRIGMSLLVCFIIIHLYMVIREEIMGKTSLVTTMFNGFRYVRTGKGG